MFHKVATTASTCSLATVAWRVNINLLPKSVVGGKPRPPIFPVVTRPGVLAAGRLTPAPEHLLPGPWSRLWSESALLAEASHSKAAWHRMFLVIGDASTMTINPADKETLTPHKRGYGDVRWELASAACGWCVRPRRSPRSSIFPPSAASLDERTPPCGVSTPQWCWTDDRGRRLAGLCGTQSASLSRKTSSGEGNSDAFTTIGKCSFTGVSGIIWAGIDNCWHF